MTSKVLSMNHHGVEFTCSDEAISDAMEFLGLDLIYFVKKSIEDMLKITDDLSRVKAMIKREVNSGCITYSIAVLSVDDKNRISFG